MNVSEMLRSTAQKNPHKTALIFGQKKISYIELAEMANRLSCALFQRGISKGEPVILMLHNSWEFVVAYYSIARCGAVTVPIDVRLKGEELAAIVTDSGARFLIIHHSLWEASQEFFSRNFSRERTIFVDEKHGQGDFFEIIQSIQSAAIPAPEIKDSDEALYYYTSGTTGKPKGVVLTFGNLDWFQVGITPYTTTDDIVGYVLPMSHVSGTLVCNEIAYRGSTLCIFDNLRPDKILQTLQQQKVNWFFSVPPIFEALLRVPHIETYTLDSLRWIAMMGTTVPVSLMEKFHHQFTFTTVIQGYGLTETHGPFTLVPLNKANSKQGSVGIPIPGAEVKVVDDGDRELSPGQAGEIVVRGPMVMKLYHNDPVSTRERIHAGWLYTGDVGRFDGDGFLYHLGRKDDMMIIGGLNVFPAEIENVLKQHSLVTDVAVVGVPDTDRGEIIKAFVVLTDGGKLTEKEIISFCRERLASYKLPKLVEFKKSLPRTSTGKVARKLLKESGT
jgi:acyl-CoA synthetase (AMP-forming)/AMP-acid ligase II